MSGVVLDGPALLALGRGHRTLAGIVTQAHRTNDRPAYAPVLCLLEAGTAREGLLDHVAALEQVHLVDLDLPGARTVAALVRRGAPAAVAHAIAVAMPDLLWRAGHTIITVRPEAYEGFEDLRVRSI